MTEKLIYVFYHCDNTYESAEALMSLHKTKKGAYLAMNSYLNEEYDKWREYKQKFKFGVHCSWRVGVVLLED